MNTPPWLRAGIVAGLVGALGIWAWEACLFVLVQHRDTLASMVDHSAYLVFGPAILRSPLVAFVLGAIVHCGTAVAWGLLFALAWPALERRGIEAAAAAVPFGALAWVVMHLGLLALFSPNPPAYTADTVVAGLFSHIVPFAVPLALTVKSLCVSGSAARMSSSSANMAK